MKKIISLLITVAICLTAVVGCKPTEAAQEDIIVLFTNDVHCGVDDNIGYAGLAAYKEYCESITPYTTLVDCGDSIQGGLIGTVSDGEYIVDIMNHLEYDLAVLGNHEFDFGMEGLSYLIDKANAKYLGCNINYTGSGTNAVAGVEPYEIVGYGEVSVAFIGVTTPHTLTSSTPTYFMENGEFVYQFNNGGAEEFYDCVQGYIEECEELGADHIVLLTHLGDLVEEAPYSVIDLIENTSGVDAVLDGHSHSEIPCRPVYDEEGKVVMLSSTGTKLENIGQLTISADGTITTSLVSQFDWKDDAADAFVKSIQAEYETAMNSVIATSELDLSICDENGIRLVRNRETAIGNFCADAYRYVTGADIGVVNGGGVRANIEKGDVTYADLIAVHPFGNTLCMIEITGAELLDALEVSYSVAKNVYAEDGHAVGENGEFMHVSGIKVTVDTSIESAIAYDENGMVESIGDARRVTSVTVLNKNGEYEPLDLEKTYTLASHNYYLKDNGGNHTFFDDNKLLIDESIEDYQVLISYITEHLDGVIDERYADVEGRITIS